jgi:hypothetical protein
MDAQRAIIERAVEEVGRKASGPDVQTGLCATLTARNAAGVEVWIQVIAGNINMVYPFADHPVARFRLMSAFGPLKVELIDWQADTYVTWDTSGIAARDVAYLVDRFFTTILGCDDAYAPTATLEDLDA